MKVLRRLRGLRYYSDFYIKNVQILLANVWKREDYQASYSVMQTFGMDIRFFDKIDMSIDEIVDMMFAEPTILNLRIACYILKSQNKNDISVSADRLMVNRLENVPQTNDVLLMKWYHYFVLFKEEYITYDELCKFIKKQPVIDDMRNFYLDLFITTRVAVQIAMDYDDKSYKNFTKALGENNPFVERYGVSTIYPNKIYSRILEERRSSNRETLRKYFVEKFDGKQAEFFHYYLNTHFKYVVRLNEVLEIMFDEAGKVSNSMFHAFKLYFYVTMAGASNSDSDRLFIRGIIRNCMADMLSIEIENNVNVEVGMECKLFIDTYIPKKTDSNGLRYRMLMIPQDDGHWYKAQILKRKSPYDALFGLFEKIIKKKRIDKEDIDELRNVNCSKLEKFYIRRFYRWSAQIISDSAMDVSILREFIEVLNDLGVNLCDFDKNPDKREYGKELFNDRLIAICRYKTYKCWENWNYKGTIEEELKIKKDIVWICFNSYLRFYSSLDQLCYVLLSERISNKELFAYCFDDFWLKGALAKNETFDGDIKSITMKISQGNFLHYRKEDEKIAESLPDRSMVMYRLYDWTENTIWVKDLRGCEHDYSRQFDAMMRGNSIHDVLIKFSKSSLVGQYTYGEMLKEWGSRHVKKETFYRISVGMGNLIFNGFCTNQNNATFEIKELHPGEKFEVGMPQTGLEEQRKYNLVLTGYDMEREIMYFEVWE
jgi:hypothetical protein